MNTLYEQTTMVPVEGRKALSEWLDSYKKGRDDFKRIMDDGYSRLEVLMPDAFKCSEQ